MILQESPFKRLDKTMKQSQRKGSAEEDAPIKRTPSVYVSKTN